MPFSRCVASLKRHLMKFQQGLQDEDHLAAIMFNAMALIHYEEMIERGVLPAELNDMPAYRVIKQGEEGPASTARRLASQALKPATHRSGPADAGPEMHRTSEPMQTYPGFLHLNGNLLVSVDLETTGRRPGYHEIIQIACVPLDSDLKPAKGLSPFYTEIKPNFPERAEPQAQFKHNIPMERLLSDAPDQDKVKDLFVEWFERLDLPMKKSLVPLAHNWAFESKLAEGMAGHHALRRNLVQPRPRRDAAGHRHQRQGRHAWRGHPLQSRGAWDRSAASSTSSTSTPTTPWPMPWPRRKSTGPCCNCFEVKYGTILRQWPIHIGPMEQVDPIRQFRIAEPASQHDLRTQFHHPQCSR